jgi:hypothetical protein
MEDVLAYWFGPYNAQYTMASMVYCIVCCCLALNITRP